MVGIEFDRTNSDAALNVLLLIYFILVTSLIIVLEIFFNGNWKQISIRKIDLFWIPLFLITIVTQSIDWNSIWGRTLLRSERAIIHAGGQSLYAHIRKNFVHICLESNHDMKEFYQYYESDGPFYLPFSVKNYCRYLVESMENVKDTLLFLDVDVHQLVYTRNFIQESFDKNSIELRNGIDETLIWTKKFNDEVSSYKKKIFRFSYLIIISKLYSIMILSILGILRWSRAFAEYRQERDNQIKDLKL